MGRGRALQVCLSAAAASLDGAPCAGGTVSLEAYPRLSVIPRIPRERQCCLAHDRPPLSSGCRLLHQGGSRLARPSPDVPARCPNCLPTIHASPRRLLQPGGRGPAQRAQHFHPWLWPLLRPLRWGAACCSLGPPTQAADCCVASCWANHPMPRPVRRGGQASAAPC